MKPTNPPMDVTPISSPAQRKKKMGRPPTLEFPPLPQEILDGMSELEQQHFDYFCSAYELAYQKKYGKITPTARINITQAGLDYIHLWRLQTEQMTTKKLVSMARQHPGVQVRAWLASAGLQEKDMEQALKPEDERSATRAQLLSLAD